MYCVYVPHNCQFIHTYIRMFAHNPNISIHCRNMYVCTTAYVQYLCTQYLTYCIHAYVRMYVCTYVYTVVPTYVRTSRYTRIIYLLVSKNNTNIRTYDVHTVYTCVHTYIHIHSRSTAYVHVHTYVRTCVLNSDTAVILPDVCNRFTTVTGYTHIQDTSTCTYKILWKILAFTTTMFYTYIHTYIRVYVTVCTYVRISRCGEECLGSSLMSTVSQLIQSRSQ